MYKVRNKILTVLISISGCLLGFPWIAQPDQPLLVSSKTLPDPTSLIDMVLNLPTHTYKGHITVTQWSENNSRVEEVNIYYTTPNKYRLEFLRPDGKVD